MRWRLARNSLARHLAHAKGVKAISAAKVKTDVSDGVWSGYFYDRLPARLDELTHKLIG